jgi:hypothetical protein
MFYFSRFLMITLICINLITIILLLVIVFVCTCVRFVYPFTCNYINIGFKLVRC